MRITVILWTCPKGHFKFWWGQGLALSCPQIIVDYTERMFYNNCRG
nr:MAG TPA: hypothetical protein [Caudoviricetes sp.]